MDLNIPHPQPRENGDYKAWTSISYGNPYGIIHLAEGNGLDLRDIKIEDCDRLIKAAQKIRTELAGHLAKAAVPHGRDNLYQGTCQLCGKPADDELHADAAETDGGA